MPVQSCPMTGFRTAFAAVLSLWLLPIAAHAGDVTVDYSQLDAHPVTNVYAPLISTSDLSAPKTPIHLHPLVATMTSPTVKNLAAQDVKPAIHLHPPAPKMLATTAPVQPVMPVSAQQNDVAQQGIQAPITTIDLALAAVPAPKVTEETASSAPVAPPEPIQETAKVVDAPKPTEEVASADVPADAPTTQTDIALDRVIVPAAKPKAAKPAETLAATTPVAPPAPRKPMDDMPSGFIRANAVAGKMDDLTPQDVVGLDFGPPEKQVNN